MLELGKVEVAATLGALITVIGVLWRMISAWYEKEAKRLIDCEKKHSDVQGVVVDLTGRINLLTGRMEGVESLSKSVLKAIEESNTCKKSPSCSRTDSQLLQ